MVTFTTDIFDQEIDRIFRDNKAYISKRIRSDEYEVMLDRKPLQVYGMQYILKTKEEINKEGKQGATYEKVINGLLGRIANPNGMYYVEKNDDNYQIIPKLPENQLLAFKRMVELKPPPVTPARKLTRSEIEENEYQNSVLAIQNKIKRLNRELQLPKNKSKRENIQLSINGLRYDLDLMEKKRDDAARAMGGTVSKPGRKNYKNRRWKDTRGRYGSGSYRRNRRGGKTGYGGGRGRLLEELKF